METVFQTTPWLFYLPEIHPLKTEFSLSESETAFLSHVLWPYCQRQPYNSILFPVLLPLQEIPKMLQASILTGMLSESVSGTGTILRVFPVSRGQNRSVSLHIRIGYRMPELPFLPVGNNLPPTAEKPWQSVHFYHPDTGGQNHYGNSTPPPLSFSDSSLPDN